MAGLGDSASLCLPGASELSGLTLAPVGENFHVKKVFVKNPFIWKILFFLNHQIGPKCLGSRYYRTFGFIFSLS